MGHLRRNNPYDFDAYRGVALGLEDDEPVPEKPSYDLGTDDILPELGETSLHERLGSLSDDDLFR